MTNLKEVAHFLSPGPCQHLGTQLTAGLLFYQHHRDEPSHISPDSSMHSGDRNNTIPGVRLVAVHDIAWHDMT